MKLPHSPRSRCALSMLGMVAALALLSGCHKPADDNAAAMPAVATTPDASLPAEPTTMMPPAPANGSMGNAYDTQGTSSEMPAPASTAIPPPVDSSEDANANGDTTTPANPASPSNDGNG